MLVSNLCPGDLARDVMGNIRWMCVSVTKADARTVEVTWWSFKSAKLISDRHSLTGTLDVLECEVSQKNSAT